MKKAVIISLVAVLCVTLLVCTACNAQLNSISKAQKSAAEKVTSFDCVATVTDGGTVVYVYSKNLTLMTDSMSVTTVESKLNSSFVLEEKSTSVDMLLDRSHIKSVSLTSKNVSEIQETAEGLQCKVSNDNISSLFGVNVQADGDAVVTVSMQGDVLNTITVSFATLSGKSVVVEYSYKY